jgi:aldose 1-epimerase
MKRRAGRVVVLFSCAAACFAQYSARQDGEVVHLEDADHQIRVSIVPGIGNVAFEMRVKGKNVLHFPYADLAEFRSRPGLNGIPFLAPWANRLDEQAFYCQWQEIRLQHGAWECPRRPSHPWLSLIDQQMERGGG